MSQYFVAYMDYILHPHIYAHHTPTAQELLNHPIVNQPPADLSKYGGGKLFSE